MIRDELTKQIESNQIHHENERRNYIGASIIGSDCLRQIWYEYKGAESTGVPSKIRRTWAIGKNLEGLIIEWLEKANLRVERISFTFASEKVPGFQGHIDGIIFIDKIGSILEIKTAKDASFKIFVQKGLKIWNPQYYAQIQSYMGMSGIHSTYILVLNKDNSDISDELVTFDEIFYKSLENKALMISEAIVEPPRVHGSPLYFKCKMCKYNKTCHK